MTARSGPRTRTTSETRPNTPVTEEPPLPAVKQSRAVRLAVRRAEVLAADPFTPLKACTAKHCPDPVWPATEEFFPKDARASDGLDPFCRLTKLLTAARLYREKRLAEALAAELDGSGPAVAVPRTE